MQYLNNMLGTQAEKEKPEMKEIGSQAYETEGLQTYMKAYEENEEKLQSELQKKDDYIEELEVGISEMRRQRDQAFKELEISEAYGLRLLRQTTQYRMNPRGKAIHFCERCPHYAKAYEVQLCQVCVAGGTVFDHLDRSASLA